MFEGVIKGGPEQGRKKEENGEKIRQDDGCPDSMPVRSTKDTHPALAGRRNPRGGCYPAKRATRNLAVRLLSVSSSKHFLLEVGRSDTKRNDLMSSSIVIINLVSIIFR